MDNILNIDMDIMLKCVNKGGYHLTVGKNYLAKVCDDAPSDFFPGNQVFDYYIVNDKGVKHGIEGDLFIRVDKLRIRKLKELGI